MKSRTLRQQLSRRLSAWLVVFLVGMAGLIATATPAQANTGGYPDYNKPCVAVGDPQYGQTSGTGYWCNGYQWGDSPSAQNSSRGYGYRNCTDFVAWKIKQVYNVTLPLWSHAKNWDEAAAAAGYTVNTTPAVGAIAVWNNGDFGHVAYVSAVNGTTATFQEYNKYQDGNYTDNRTGTAEKYIHIGPPPGGGGTTPTPTPTDSDGDGSADASDACPYVPGKTYNRGCRMDGHTVTGNFYGNDGYTDSVTFYDYTAQNLGAFLSVGSANGLARPTYLWETGTGQWVWGNSQFFAGNFAGGDTWTDVIGLYNYGSGKLGAFLFQGNGNGVGQAQHLWTTPNGAWHLGSGKYVVGNFYGNDGVDDIQALYDLTDSNMGAFVFPGTGSGIGQNQLLWTTGVGQWNMARAEIVAGNFAGNDNLTDVVAFYGYDNNDMAAFLFQGTASGLGQRQGLWSTGPGQWNVRSAQFVVGNFAGNDGNTDVAALYDLGDSNTGAFVFQGNGSGVNQNQLLWTTGVGQFSVTRTKALAGEFGGSSTGIFVFYNYDNSNTGGFHLPSTTVGVQQPQGKWSTGINQYNWYGM